MGRVIGSKMTAWRLPVKVDRRAYRFGVLRRLFRIGLWTGVLVGLMLLWTKVRQSQPAALPASAPSREPWPRLTDEPVADTRAWIEPTGAVCPTSHPVKASVARSIFHLPGGASYERVKPERCYRTAADAEADGLRAAKR